MICFSQTREDIARRFNNYINFRGSLSNVVSLGDSAFSILDKGQPEFTAYAREWPVITDFLLHTSIDQQKLFYAWKKNRKLSMLQLDSIRQCMSSPASPANTTAPGKKLAGIKIAIDPGHIAGNMTMARLEQKFLDFSPDPQNKLKDTVHIAEGILTYNTAFILRQMLEEQGANVFVTRPSQNCSAFGTSYDYWYSHKRVKILDSLLKTDNMTPARHKQLMKMDRRKLFWEFFRDFELLERARIMNQYKPDLAIIIHYNVDENNTDWLNPSYKNYTMTFIGGGMTADNLAKPANKCHLLRLLLSGQLERSEKISSLTVSELSETLGIPKARQNDADYLRDNCLKTASGGVFCRNLVLCRTVNAPLVYGECLYQDYFKECELLNHNDFSIYGITVPKRLYEVAGCYYRAVLDYFSKP